MRLTLSITPFYAKIPCGGTTMKIETRQMNDKPLTVIIEYPKLDTRTQKLIRKIKSLDLKVSGTSNGTVFQIPVSDICYAESLERKTFLYTEKDVYLTDKKLYELEEQLREAGIIRISKSCLMNVDMLDSVKRLTNSQLEATLQNGEKLIVARTYLKQIKNRLREDM